MTEKTTSLDFLSSNQIGNGTPDPERWQVLVVDDDEQVHLLSKLVLKGYSYHGHGLSLIHAYSAKEALEVLSATPQIALVLLDVVMETTDAGLLCVQQIREVLKNDTVQIVLRTGQAGDVPEQLVMQQYDINDYKCKTDLTKDKLFTTVTSSLRAFEHVSKLKRVTRDLQELNLTLEHKVTERTVQLEQTNLDLEGALREIERQQFSLVQAEKLASLGQLAAGVAHEFNNPLGFLFSNMEFIKTYFERWFQMWKNLQQAQVNSPDEFALLLQTMEKQFQLDWVFCDAKDMLEDIDTGLKRIQAIVKDLSVLTADGSKQRQVVHIEQLIDTVLDRLSPMIPDACSVEYEVNEVSAIECVNCQLGTALMIILKNAFDFIDKPHSLVKISSYDLDEDHVIITIKDNGQGIAPENKNKIFDPFYTTKPIGSGTGLGLCLALAIIKSHFGTIDIDSKLGEYTHVSITLPVGL
ncbi:hypothetical protein PALB_10080 [Pseudoalteromonas luteoviolacea B = ATCC 29581]|nr:hypothetical protein PALB_10080 [Pseudoalteromonas luteoviolacea B = ATCC 29581]